MGFMVDLTPMEMYQVGDAGPCSVSLACTLVVCVCAGVRVCGCAGVRVCGVGRCCVSAPSLGLPRVSCTVYLWLLVQPQRVMDVNFFAGVRITKALLPLLMETKGRVVNITSTAGFAGAPQVCAGLDALFRDLFKRTPAAATRPRGRTPTRP
jgi:NAD(P)-dependent dehydrogenase (short-subunit alcohol dehydrogenase family)